MDAQIKSYPYRTISRKSFLRCLYATPTTILPLFRSEELTMV